MLLVRKNRPLKPNRITPTPKIFYIKEKSERLAVLNNKNPTAIARIEIPTARYIFFLLLNITILSIMFF